MCGLARSVVGISLFMRLVVALLAFAAPLAWGFAAAPVRMRQVGRPSFTPPPKLPLKPVHMSILPVEPSGAMEAAGTTLAFADQAGNLAGTFFQASLLPYVIFLYFIGYEGNGTPRQAYFGFQFLLLFVLSTVFTGIVTKSVYSSSLADVDWLHGGAETLLTTTNLYVASGFRNAIAGEAPPEGPSFRFPAFAVFALVVVFTAIGPQIGFEQHSAFFFGLGNLESNPLEGILPFARAEPVNALSIPTWAIHFSSVFEWLFAMGMVWTYAKATGNEKWKWLTYGMLPLHASGVAACTYHFFYNNPDVSFLVALQAGLTLLGNTTVAIAAVAIALSNGWTLEAAIKSLNPFDKGGEEEEGEEGGVSAPAPPSLTTQQLEPTPLVAAELVLATALASFVMKYGETALGVAFEPNAILGWLICLSIPAAVGFRFYSLPSA
jgi:hypothetical protein